MYNTLAGKSRRGKLGRDLLILQKRNPISVKPEVKVDAPFWLVLFFLVSPLLFMALVLLTHYLRGG
jgi:hypothetical protein